MRNKVRTIAGIAILVILAVMAAVLAPSYVRNVRLRQYLEAVVRRPEMRALPDDRVRAAVADRAARLGIPLKPSDIRLDRSMGGLRIEARYIVRIDLPIYTVDLHFRAGGRSR